MVILISGPSGAGKSTIIKALMDRHKNLKLIKTFTTREKRTQEDDSHFFVSKKEFEELINSKKLFEFENVHDDIFYGTPLSVLEEVLEGKNNFIKDIDVKGMLKLKKFFNGKAKVFTIFLDNNDQILAQRLKARGESEEMINKRISRAKMERDYLDEYDMYLICDDIQKTVDKIEDFIGFENFA